jgi:hypothetical protein
VAGTMVISGIQQVVPHFRKLLGVNRVCHGKWLYMTGHCKTCGNVFAIAENVI